MLWGFLYCSVVSLLLIPVVVYYEHKADTCVQYHKEALTVNAVWYASIIGSVVSWISVLTTL